MASAGGGSQGAGSLQAFAFCCESSPARGRAGSASAPASPAGRRTLLYTRAGTGAVAGQQPQQLAVLAAPAIDLLDRLTLLRRLAPSTDPAPRPPGLAPATQTFTPAPAGPDGRFGLAAASTLAAPGTAGIGGGRRWAWDDSLLGLNPGHTTQNSASTGRPMTAVPAPGWMYCGDVVAAAPAAVTAQGGPLCVAAAAAGCSTGSIGLKVAVAACGGEACALSGPPQLPGQGADETLLVVRSPRPHQLHSEEGAVQSAAAPGAAACRDGASRAAFRPPGPLRHKFGNKPAQRPPPAPTREERARAAGLRGCGCPRSPRRPSGEAGPKWQGRGRARRSSSGGHCVSWASEEGVEAVAMLTSRPRSAAVEELRRSSLATAEASIPARPSSACLAMEGRWPPRRDVAAATCTAAVGSPTCTTSVSVTAQGDVIVVSSPRAASAGLGSQRQEAEEVVVVATSPRGRGKGGSDVVVVCREPANSLHRPAQQPPAEAATATAEDQCTASRTATHTKLTVTVPAGGGGSFRVRANGSGPAAAAAPAARAFTDSAPSSPIKAWRPQPVAAAPVYTATVHAAASAGRAVASAEVNAMAGPAAAPSVHATRMAELERLEGEMRRRERSFNDLLRELDSISAKCARLTASTSPSPSRGAAPSAAGCTGRSAGQGQQRRRSGEPHGGRSLADGHRQQQQVAQQPQHTTQHFGSLEAAIASSSVLAATGCGEQAVAAGPDGGPCGGGRADDADWGWENLLAFEQQIREQQRKVGLGLGTMAACWLFHLSGGLAGLWLGLAPAPTSCQIQPHLHVFLPAAGGAGCAACRICIVAACGIAQQQQQQSLLRVAGHTLGQHVTTDKVPSPVLFLEG